MALGRDRGLLLGTEVQLMVSYTTIEARLFSRHFLCLVTGQLSITGQLGKEVHPRSVRLLLGEWGMEIVSRKDSWWTRLSETDLPCSGRL